MNFSMCQILDDASAEDDHEGGLWNLLFAPKYDPIIGEIASSDW